jgi:hypothetical protein
MTTGSKQKARKAAVLACTLVLALGLLSACSTQSSTNDGDASTGAIDPSSWKTVGDALATQTDAVQASWNDKYYVSVFKADDQYFRIVGIVDDEAKKKGDAVDWSADDVDEQNREAYSGCALKSAEDITGDLVSQEELDKLVGKTGKELADEGYTFAGYFMYGGDETGAQFDKGYFQYSMTFKVKVEEKDTDDGGASVQDATVTEATFLNAADSAVNPENVED